VAIKPGNGNVLRIFASEEIALRMLSKEGLLSKPPREMTAQDKAALFCEIPNRIHLQFAEHNPLHRSNPNERRKLRKLAAKGA
jgi:hypothetical protein